jgi:segregation and condensation protein B
MVEQEGSKPAETPRGGEGGESSRNRAKGIVESLIFVSEKPITVAQLGKILRLKPPEIRELVQQLTSEYEGRGVELIEAAGGYRFRTASENASYVREFLTQRPVRLTRAQLETLSIVAYRQPVTRPEIEEIRGVDTGSAVRVLLDRGLLKLLGRKDEPGRPLLYGTTPYFLEFFGMSSLKDLPTLREFSDLSVESRNLYKRKIGEELDTEASTSRDFSDDSEELADESEISPEDEDSPEGSGVEAVEDNGRY